MERRIYSNLHSMWDKIDIESTQRQGYQWGKQYLENLIDEMVTLKENAKKENNPYLYNQLRTSLIRAHEVQLEINNKLKN